MTLDVHTARPGSPGRDGCAAPGDPGGAAQRGVRAPDTARLPADGRRAGRVGTRARLRQRRGGPRARLRGAGPDPGRRWSDDALAGGQAGDAARGLARDHRRRGERAGDGGVRPLRARPELGARGPARRDHLAHRRGGGVLGAAAGAVAAPAHRRARGRVRTQRRPDRRAGHAGHVPAGATASSATSGRSPWSSAWASRAGFSSGTAAPCCCVAPRCRALASTRWRCLSFTVLAYAGSAALHGSGFAAVYVAALILGNAELPAPGGHPVVLGGGRLARPDRAVRDARPAGLARAGSTLARSASPSSPGWPSPSWRGRSRWPWRRSCSRCRRASWRSSRGRACAARCRSCWPPSRSPRRRRGDRAVRHRLRDRRDLHAADRPDAALVAKVLKVARRSEPR